MAGKKSNNFLPDSISGMLKSLLARIVGALVFVLGAWAVWATLFYNPYLSGFGVAGTFGDQSIMGHVVGFVRYAIGAIPALFVFLCVARLGFMRMIALMGEGAPEYNFLRGFIAVCVGAAGFGLITPSSAFGGIFGAIVANDLGRVMGNLSIIVGILCVVAFLWIGGSLLHIKWAHVRGALRIAWRTIRAIGAAFHLTGPVAAEELEASDDTAEVTEEVAEKEDAPQKKRRGLLSCRAPKKVAAAAAPVAPVVTPKRVRAASQYQLPDPKLLEKSLFSKCSVTPELKQNARNMETHFAEYGVFGRVMGIKPGPIVTLYEFEPDTGMRIADITKTVKDMTRAMATENIRIAHIPSTSFIGVEMVNVTRQTVRYRSLMESDTFVDTKYKIPLALGVNIGGNPMYFDLAKMPHLLIAGATGAGKSVCINTLVISLIYKADPNEVKLVMIDPKIVELSV